MKLSSVLPHQLINQYQINCSQKYRKARDYRKMGNGVKIMDHIKAEWKVKRKDLKETGLNQKDSNLLHSENRN